MANNIFLSYDLNRPGQNYAKIIERIKAQGSWAKVTESQFYLDTIKSAREIVDAVWAVMDSNDTLIAVDSTNNEAAWENLDDEVAKFIVSHWNSNPLRKSA